MVENSAAITLVKEEMDEGMKKLTLYLEIANAACDKHGRTQPAGICVTIGDPNGDEITGDEYQRVLERITVEAVLEAAGLTGVYDPSACRIIMPEKYRQKYGER